MQLTELKCTNCSGSIKVTKGQNIAVCAFCDTQYYVQQDQHGVPVDLTPVIAKLNQVASVVDGVAASVQRVETRTAAAEVASNRVVDELSFSRLQNDLLDIENQLKEAENQLALIGLSSMKRSSRDTVILHVVVGVALYMIFLGAILLISGLPTDGTAEGTEARYVSIAQLFVILMVIWIHKRWLHNFFLRFTSNKKWLKAREASLPITKQIEELTAQKVEKLSKIEAVKARLI